MRPPRMTLIREAFAVSFRLPLWRTSWERLTIHYRNLGLGGVLATSANRLFGWPTEVTKRIRGIRNPVHIRLRTSDERTYAEILRGGQYAFQLPFAPKIIIDAGANIGMASIFFAHRYPEAKVIAVEPEASNFALLAKNVQPYPAIIPVHAALWNRDGEISVSEPDAATGAFGKWAFVTHEGAGVRVRAITLRTLMTEMGISAVDLLKIDIEGAEKEVFESCDWMEDIGCLMVELHDRFKPGCSEALKHAVQGFSTTQRGEITLYIRAA